MVDRLRIDYLATFDTGNASIRWPQKNAFVANDTQHQFDAETRNAFKLNLLIKPFISIRHFELFDNLALAKFFSANRNIMKRMTEARLIRVCSKLASSWEEICSDWALQQSQEPMHWHHLTSERQKSYDIASKNGKIRDLHSMESYLYFSEHKDVDGVKLDFYNMIALYDECFPSNRIIVTNSDESHKITYSQMVSSELNAYLKERRRNKDKLPDVVNRIKDTINECCELNVRRREFYTRLERLRHEPWAKSRKISKDLIKELELMKAFVINEAFYKEFQGFDRYLYGKESGNAYIVANRDITLSSVSGESILSEPVRPDLPDYLEKEYLPVLDAISLENILEWHTASHSEAVAFRASLRDLQESCMTRQHSFPNKQVSKYARQHIEKIRECIKRSLASSEKSEFLNAPRSEVYFGVEPDIAAGILADAGLFSLSYSHHMATGLIAATTVGILTFLLKKPAQSHSLRYFETTLESKIHASIGEEKNAD